MSTPTTITTPRSTSQVPGGREDQTPPSRIRGEKFTVAQVIAALEAAAGIKAAAAQKLRCSRQTLDNYIARHSEIRDALDRISAETLDLAEGQLLKLIAKGNLTAVIFYLKTKGRHRGYSERFEVARALDQPTTDWSRYSTDELMRIREMYLEERPLAAG